MNAMIGSTRHLYIQNSQLVHQLYISCLMKAMNFLTIENSSVVLITSSSANKMFTEYLFDKSIENTQQITEITLGNPTLD